MLIHWILPYYTLWCLLLYVFKKQTNNKGWVENEIAFCNNVEGLMTKFDISEYYPGR